MDHKITPGIKLPPMNISPRHRNFSLENTGSKKTPLELARDRTYSSVQRGKSRSGKHLNKTTLVNPRDFITAGD